jgi:glucosamine-6-phosphate deaminase
LFSRFLDLALGLGGAYKMHPKLMSDDSHSSANPMPIQSFKADAVAVRIHRTPDGLARDAAQSAQQWLQDGLSRQGRASVIFATGNSQIQTLETLAALGGVDWSRVTMFHMDEYLGIDANHPASFRRFLRERVEPKLKPRHFHYLEGDALLPLNECERYTKLLALQPIDLCLLGIGENGHIAFNDPPVADFNDSHTVKLVKLDQACREQQVGEGHFPALEAVPQYALTLTIPALCAAKRMLCIVPERRKAEAVRKALREPVSTACPASFLRQQPHCTLFLDADSASLL